MPRGKYNVKKKLTDVFDHIYIMNLKKRTDRYEHITKELDKIKLKSNYTIFPALDGDTLNETMFNVNKNIYAKIRTYETIILDAIQKKYNSILILEDDVIFDDYFINLFDKFYRQLEKQKKQWEILYLGGNHQFEKNNYQQLDENLYRIKISKKTHAIGYRKEIFFDLLRLLGNKSQPLEDILIKAQQTYFAYTFYPNITNQIPSYSDIKKEEVDYSEILK